MAASRARKLIDEYQINELDLASLKSTDLGTEAYTVNKLDKIVGMISIAVARLNDCHVVTNWKPGIGEFYEFKGMLVDVASCIEMVIWLRTELWFQKDKIKGRRAKNAYAHGFASGLQAQVREIIKDRERQKIRKYARNQRICPTNYPSWKVRERTQFNGLPVILMNPRRVILPSII